MGGDADRRASYLGPVFCNDPERLRASFLRCICMLRSAPIPLSTFAGEPSQNVGKSFLKSYAAVCLEGAVIVLACIIFSVFASSPPVVDPDAAAASMVWSYIGEITFNMLILVGSVKMSDHVVREMMGL